MLTKYLQDLFKCDVYIESKKRQRFRKEDAPHIYKNLHNHGYKMSLKEMELIGGF